MSNYTPRYLCDLHVHTKNSDGNDTYAEIIEKAERLGMKVIAIVDHDVLPLDTKEYTKNKKIRVLPGIEISCDTLVDDVHIIGLGCDYSYPRFKEFVDSMSISKVASYKKLTEILNNDGIMVTWEDVLSNDGSPLTDEQVQRKHIFEAIARGGFTKDWSEAKLLVKDNPKYEVRRNKLPAIDAIKLIHSSGGIAILAHPYLIDQNVQINGRPATREIYIDMLIENGLDGIEAAYTYEKTTYKGSLSSIEIEKIITQTYSNRLALISGGSDYHGDEKKGMSFDKARQIGEKGIDFEYFISNKFLKALL